METRHKIESTESEITECRLPVTDDLDVVRNWPNVNCSECLKRRPPSAEWMSEKKAFEEADREE